MYNANNEPHSLWSWELWNMYTVKKIQVPNGITRAKPTSPKQDLISNLTAASTSTRNVTFNHSTWNYLVSTSEIATLQTPSIPFRRVTLLEPMNSLFIIYFFRLLSVFENLSFSTAQQSSFLSARWDAAWFMTHLINPILIFKFISRIFVI